MDPLSATASFIAIIQISGQIFDLCQTYYLAVKEARGDIRRLRAEVTSLRDVLVNVNDLLDTPGDAPGDAQSAALRSRLSGPLEQCQKDLAELLTKLAPGNGKSEMKQFGLRALKWPFGSKEVDKVLLVIERYKATFNLALTTSTL
jgi:ankyrin repeat domain-containing protein 50